MPKTVEHQRLHAEHAGPVPPWTKWGPYVSDRAWGTVREDYSAHGGAWDYLPHDLARSKAYRWGEDAIAGVCPAMVASSRWMSARVSDSTRCVESMVATVVGTSVAMCWRMSSRPVSR